MGDIYITKDQLLKKMKVTEQSEKKGEDKSPELTETGNIGNLISTLLHSRNQAHVFHWQTKSNSSFAEHMALGGYYDGIVELMDGLVESYQGKHDIITGYNSSKLEDYKGVEQLISYFKSIDSQIDKDRKSVKESYIQNQIDTIQELIYSTLYKLRFLK